MLMQKNVSFWLLHGDLLCISYSSIGAFKHTYSGICHLYHLSSIMCISDHEFPSLCRYIHVFLNLDFVTGRLWFPQMDEEGDHHVLLWITFEQPVKCTWVIVVQIAIAMPVLLVFNLLYSWVFNFYLEGGLCVRAGVISLLLAQMLDRPALSL